MKNVKKRAIMISTIILFICSLLIIRVSSPAIIVTPIDTTITVASADTFSLKYKMRFDEADPGFFSVTFYWDNNETAPDAPYWNFTYVNSVCKFVDGTSFSDSINVATKKEVPYGYPPSYYRYTISVSETYGENHNGEFWLNVTMRAAGIAGGVWHPHAEGDQNVTISKVRCHEYTTLSVGPGNCTIHVTGQIDIHDVAVTSVALSATETYPGWVVNITATVRNEGTVNETFNVTAYYDNTTIGTETVINLTTLAPVNLTFSWNTTGVTPCSNYTITVEADEVPEEIETADNVYVDGTVKVKLVGDIDGNGEVDIFDITTIGLAYKSKAVDDPKTPRDETLNWNPKADIKEPWGEVDIYDLTLAGLNYKHKCV